MNLQSIYVTGFTILEVTTNLSFDVEKKQRRAEVKEESQRGAEERKAEAKEEDHRETEEGEVEATEGYEKKVSRFKTRKEISLIYSKSIC